MQVKQSQIFRKYDIRGIYGKDLTNEIVFKIGFCFGRKISTLSNPTIFIGYDGRLSSPEIFKNLINGIKSSGIEPISIGLCHSPMLYYACSQNQNSSGIMITGSHNPKEYNGMKIIFNGSVFYDQDIQELATAVLKLEHEDQNFSDIIKSINVKSTYLSRILKDLDTNLINKKIIFDSANGATGPIIKKISEKLKNSIATFTEVDGNFPNHHPDPSHFKNLISLIQTVKETKSDIGIMFDGDGDRVGFVDENASPVGLEEMIAIFATNLKENKDRNKTIILDIKCSNYLVNFLEDKGFKVIISKTGHPYIKKAIKENNALFGAELSGHVFFNDYYFGFDDGVYSAIRMIEILSKTGQKLSEIRNILPKTFTTPEILIDCDDSKKFDVIENIRNDLDLNKVSFIDIDGIKYNNEKGSWLIRASNTTPKLVLIVNSKSEEGLHELEKIAKDLVKKYNI